MQRWLLVHRAHLHDGLKAAAQDPKCIGIPAILHTSSKVVDVDPSEATVILENGEVVQGDVLVGADGVHSLTRKKLQGARDVKPFSSGKNAFRFLITRKEALDDVETRPIVEDHGCVDMWDGDDRRVVIYPCADNQILNFVCIHPDNLTKIDGKSDWDQEVSKEKLVEVFQGFSPQVIKLLEKADPRTIKVWPLLDMETLPTWVEDKLAILGDAAHPFLPYRASGGAMAIEDGVSLGVMLSGNVQRHEVSERLALYEKARHHRATTVQEMTRKSGQGLLQPDVGMFIHFISTDLIQINY